MLKKGFNHKVLQRIYTPKGMTSTKETLKA